MPGFDCLLDVEHQVGPAPRSVDDARGKDRIELLEQTHRHTADLSIEHDADWRLGAARALDAQRLEAAEMGDEQQASSRPLDRLHHFLGHLRLDLQFLIVVTQEVDAIDEYGREGVKVMQDIAGMRLAFEYAAQIVLRSTARILRRQVEVKNDRPQHVTHHGATSQPRCIHERGDHQGRTALRVAVPGAQPASIVGRRFHVTNDKRERAIR